jgi:type I site-specific restriction endonuclease
MGSSSFPPLNLPTFDVKLRNVEQRTEIFDCFRQRYVKLTPEEWVRQHTLHYLVNHYNYPKNRIAVELTLNLNKLTKRADIIVYNAALAPWMIIECKAAGVKLSQAVFDQAARYNLVMNVPFLAITNGLQLLAAEIVHTDQKINRLEQLPLWH